VLDLNANEGKGDIELAVSIGVAHPGARQHVRSSFCLKDVGFRFPRDPTRPCRGANAFRLREKRKFQEPWPQHVRNIEYLMRANDSGAEHDSKTVALRAHETNRRVFDVVFVTTARLFGRKCKSAWQQRRIRTSNSVRPLDTALYSNFSAIVGSCPNTAAAEMDTSIPATTSRERMESMERILVLFQRSHSRNLSIPSRDFCFGSVNRVIWLLASYFRSFPISGRRSGRSSCLKGAHERTSGEALGKRRAAALDTAVEL